MFVGNHFVSFLFAKCKVFFASLLRGPNGEALLPPFSIGYVKGWRRSSAMPAAMAGIYLLEIDLDELNANFKVGCVMHTG